MTHHKYTKLFIAFVLILAACNKEKHISGKEDKRLQVDPAKVYHIPTSAAELKLVESIGKVTTIFKELYKDPSNIKLVNAAILSKAYTDESVLLSALIYPETSKLKSVKKFAVISGKWGVSLETFAANFWKETAKLNDGSFESFLTTLRSTTKTNIEVTSAENTDETENAGPDLTVYFPYNEEFLPEDGGSGSGGSYGIITTITTATADADEGIGELPFYLNGQFQYYTPVLVNDEYCEANPTHIIGVNGIEPYDVEYLTQTYIAPGPPIDEPSLIREVKQVYIGDVRCKKKWFQDALISISNNGGGNEIVFTRSDGFLKVVDGQVQETAEVFKLQEVYLSRRTISKGNWVEAQRLWDGDWEIDNRTQNLAIFEQDNRNDKEISGEISTTIKLADLVTFTIAPVKYKLTFKSDDLIIEQTDFKRDVFFTLNRSILDELYRGWPIRSQGANVSFTFWDRTLF